jgi:CRISPR system Cascade subunit CasC
MFIELHLIQNFAPSNLNRDDTNSPKDCEFGGVRRARISSQCIKRSIRQHPVFANTTGVENGQRTRWLGRLVKDALIQSGKPEDQAVLVANLFASEYAGKTEKHKESDLDRTSVLIYFSPEEIQAIASGLIAEWEAALSAAQNPQDKEVAKTSPVKNLVNNLVKQSKGRTSAPDIALFGRMLANDPNLNLEASCQVAHAISTHAVSMDLDFFTAVDDLQPSEETGAGMMGVTGFNSACFYRYACLDWEQLVTNLDGDRDLAARTVVAFLRAAIAAIPTGKQNSFAAQNPPSFVMAVVRKDGLCWSLANAFEKPIRSHADSGIVARSVEALDAYWGRIAEVYGTEGVQSYTLLVDNGLRLETLQGTEFPNLTEWVKSVGAAVLATG